MIRNFPETAGCIAHSSSFRVCRVSTHRNSGGSQWLASPYTPPRPRAQPESTPNHSRLQIASSVTSTSTNPNHYCDPRRSVSAESEEPASDRPTIVSIIDQFSHICLYRLHQGKWLKDGFESASFLLSGAYQASHRRFATPLTAPTF